MIDDCKNKMNQFFSFSFPIFSHFSLHPGARPLLILILFVFHLILCHAYLIRKIFVSFLEALWPEFRLALFISIFGMYEQRNDGK